MANNANTNTNTNAAAKAAQPAATAAKPAASLPAPANTFAAPTGRSTVTVVCQPGTTYGLAVPHNGATVVLPFALPGKAAQPVPVVLASTNANWLGRNGAPLVVHLCTGAQPGMAVALQPHGQGYKANAYTTGVTVQSM